MKKIIIKEEYCIGCRLCEIYCVVSHSKSKNILKTFKSLEGKPISCLVFEEKGYVSFSLQCRHCDDAVCVLSCPTSAMYKNKEGIVLHDKDKCIGCWMCIMVCPFGVIKADFKNKKVASKCDLCIEIGQPYCVENCPNEAIFLSQ